jgi:hypothetical protein
MIVHHTAQDQVGSKIVLVLAQSSTAVMTAADGALRATSSQIVNFIICDQLCYHGWILGGS